MSRSLTRRPPAASSSPRRSGVAPRARLALPLLAALSLAPSAGCLKVPDDGSHEPEKRDAPATAEEVFARYIAALGGEDQLRALKQRTVEARMIVKPELGCDEDDEQCLREEQVGSFLLQKADGNRLYRSTVLGDQVEERGYDGEVGWQYVAGVLRQDDPQMNEISREDSILHWYFGLAERGIKLTLEPPRDKDFDGQPRVLDGVRWTVMARPEATKTLWFDRDTGLLVEERVEAKADDATTILQRMIYNDYREVDGVQIAHDLRLINSIGERAQEIEFVSTRVHHEPVADEKFEVPDVPPPEPLEDRVLTALESARADAKAAPKDRDAQLRYARAAWAAAHFDEADAAAQATLKLDAKEVEAVWYLARLRILQGR